VWHPARRADGTETAPLRLAVRRHRPRHRVGELEAHALLVFPRAILMCGALEVHGDCDQVIRGAIRPDPRERLPDTNERGLGQVFRGVWVGLTRKEPEEPRPEPREQCVERAPSTPLRVAHEGPELVVT